MTPAPNNVKMMKESVLKTFHWIGFESTLIGHLATVHICDWLKKDKQIHKLSSIIFMSQVSTVKWYWKGWC